MERRALLKTVDLYFITDSKLSRSDVVSDAAAAFDAGCRILQYREKDATTAEMTAKAKAIKELSENRALFIVNDRVDVALACDADGVHIGDDDMPYDDAREILGDNRIIGVSVDTLWEAEQAQLRGADYVGLGPIYATSTKTGLGEPCGVEAIAHVKKRIHIPLVAIGGITAENVKPVIAAGADAAAVVSAVVAVDDVGVAVRRFREEIQAARK